MLNVVCYGEVLWDVFPNHKKIGGAPLNVALRLNSFGVQTTIISSIGNDQNGRELLKYTTNNKLDDAAIQINDQYETGWVHVTLDEKGSASYEIAYPVAWDKIELTENSIEKVKASDAFIFGSLACRDSHSKNTLIKLLTHAKFKVFDVNLRPPHYTMDLLLDLMIKADFIKCNDDELDELCHAFAFKSNTMQEQIEFLAKKTNTSKICVTRGGDGAILLIDGKYYANDGYVINVADTVGAGDSFLAALIYKFLSNTSPQQALDFAIAVGTLVASKSGANPTLSNSQILGFIENGTQ